MWRAGLLTIRPVHTKDYQHCRHPALQIGAAFHPVQSLASPSPKRMKSGFKCCCLHSLPHTEHSEYLASQRESRPVRRDVHSTMRTVKAYCAAQMRQEPHQVRASHSKRMNPAVGQFPSQYSSAPAKFKPSGEVYTPDFFNETIRQQ